MASGARVEWTTPIGTLTAVEPGSKTVRDHAAALVDAYNEPHNRSMMGHDPMSEADVVDYYAAMSASGGRLFLLFFDGALAGDADFRHVSDGHAEFAIMIGARATQGKGLGTRFAQMLHALAFKSLGVDRVYVTIIKANSASLRLFEKLGYTPDTSVTARSFVDDEEDVAMSIGRREFETLHKAPLAEIVVAA